MTFFLKGNTVFSKMGVQSVTKFISKKRSGRFYSLAELGSRPFYIDGHSLLYALSLNLDWRCGGQLQELRNRVTYFCNGLRHFGVRHFMVYMDGSKSNLKRDTLNVRLEKRLELLRDVFSNKREVGSGTILPPTSLPVFVDTLLKNGANVYVVAGEADGILCRDARKNNGIVCTDDSDCFIYENRGVILLRDLLNLSADDPNPSLYVYDRTMIARSILPDFHLHWLPIFAVLCGNDHTRPKSPIVIDYISRKVPYGYFLIRIAKYIAHFDGNLKDILQDLLDNKVLNEEETQLFAESVRGYKEVNNEDVTVRQLTSMEDDFLYTMFPTPVKATMTGRCYLGVTPYDIENCTFDIWQITAPIRRLIYKLLSPEHESIVEFRPSGQTSVDCDLPLKSKANFSESPRSPLTETSLLDNKIARRIKETKNLILPQLLFGAKKSQKLDLLHTLLFDAEAPIRWKRKWKKTRSFALACAYCRSSLDTKNKASWDTFETRLESILKGKSQHKNKLEDSQVSQYYVLFQLVSQHLNLLSGILDIYDVLPPFLDFVNGSSLKNKNLIQQSLC